MLIIDDLGTELNNSFVSSQLSIVSMSASAGKRGTIISTNLSMGMLQGHLLRPRYIPDNEAITVSSRFYGADIRMKKRAAGV